MRLFHVSEEKDIGVFYPRIPKRKELDQTQGLVWAVDQRRLPNFLTPRNCPRVTYHMGINTTLEDQERYFSSATTKHVVVIESKWFQVMKNTVLYLYVFDPSGFELQDDIAGYYVSKTVQTPIAKYRVDDLFQELFDRRVEVRIVDNLWDIYERISKSSLSWSMCRMGYAQER